MATTALTVAAERWLDQVILAGAVNNNAGATIQEFFTIPAGLGDVAILNMIVTFINIATVPGTATANRGIECDVFSKDATTRVDTIGTAELFASGGTLAAFDRFAASVDPDALVLVRQDELINIQAPEMDVNAAPTGDMRVTIKCVRVRLSEPTTVPGPIRLVR